MILALCQLLGGLILTIGIIPQIIQIIKTKRADDLNGVSILTVFGGVVLMEVYAVGLLLQGTGLPFFITNTLSLFLQGIFAIVVLTYKRKAKVDRRNNEV